MDAKFNVELDQFLIQTEEDIDKYAYYVASTIAMLVLDLIYYFHYPNKSDNDTSYLKKKLKRADIQMGKALQCVNIARDIGRDAAINQVYIPTTWLTAVNLTSTDVIQHSTFPGAHLMQQKMLNHAEGYYRESHAAIEELPSGAREPVRVTVENYFEIGRVLRSTREIRTGGGKLRFPLCRRLVVAWVAMWDGYP